MAEPVLWFRPVCDTLLLWIYQWYANYERGEVYSTRDWLNLDNVVVKKPTRYAHRLSVHPLEMRHLVTILQALEPDHALTKDIIHVNSKLRQGQLRPGGKYVITLAYYKEDIAFLLHTLLRAKTGRAVTLEQVLVEQQQAGKGMFEL